MSGFLALSVQQNCLKFSQKMQMIILIRKSGRILTYVTASQQVTGAVFSITVN